VTIHSRSSAESKSRSCGDPLARVKDDDLRILIIDLDTIFDVVNFSRAEDSVSLTNKEADFVADTIRAAVGFLSELRCGAR
jgi:hypothetical protein